MGLLAGDDRVVRIDRVELLATEELKLEFMVSRCDPPLVARQLSTVNVRVAPVVLLTVQSINVVKLLAAMLSLARTIQLR